MYDGKQIQLKFLKKCSVFADKPHLCLRGCRSILLKYWCHIYIYLLEVSCDGHITCTPIQLDRLGKQIIVKSLLNKIQLFDCWKTHKIYCITSFRKDLGNNIKVLFTNKWKLNRICRDYIPNYVAYVCNLQINFSYWARFIIRLSSHSLQFELGIILHL